MIKRVKLVFLKMEEINIILLISSLVGIGMVVARIVYTRELAYAFLVWNLFLAWIPFEISSRLRKSTNLQNNNILLISWSSLWLLFYPNAPYIVTDLFHLTEIEGAPLWYDLILIMIFALNGLVFSILSLHDMHSIAVKKKDKTFGALFLVFIIVLTGFGVYLGRYERWNSWDLFIHTRELLSNIIYILLHPIKHARAYGFTLLFSVFMSIIYFMIYYTAGSISKKKVIL